MKKLQVVIVLLVFVALLLTACAAPATDSADTGADASADAADSTEDQENEQSGDDSASAPAEDEDDLAAKIEAADAAADGLLISDGNHKMIDYMEEAPALPEKPTDETALEYYYMQFAGREITPENIPESPKDGSWGKKVYLIVSGDHPSLTALADAAGKVADIYGIEMIVKSPNFDLNQQNQIIDQAINDNPDYILLMPVDQQASTAQFKKINEAGIPCSAFLSMPANDAFKYIVGYSGVDDWLNYQALADKAGAMVDGEGGVIYMTHMPGDPSYFSRYLGYEAQLAENYPNLTTLDTQTPGAFDAQKSTQMLQDMLIKYGDQIKMIEMADDATFGTSLKEAATIANFDLSKVVVAASGNSKAGMELLKDGVIDVMVFQSLEQCGAVPMKLVADWFNGKEVPRHVFLNPDQITAENVEEYEPASW